MKHLILLVALLLSMKGFCQSTDNTAYYEIVVRQINADEFKSANVGKPDTSMVFYFYNIWKTTYSGTTSGYEHGYCHRHLDVAGKLASQGWYIVSSTAIHEDIGNEINYVLEKRK